MRHETRRAVIDNELNKNIRSFTLTESYVCDDLRIGYDIIITDKAAFDKFVSDNPAAFSLVEIICDASCCCQVTLKFYDSLYAKINHETKAFREGSVVTVYTQVRDESLDYTYKPKYIGVIANYTIHIKAHNLCKLNEWMAHYPEFVNVDIHSNGTEYYYIAMFDAFEY